MDPDADDFQNLMASFLSRK